jgi:predicted 3-demethylubiquinone-9 3-methyltransferase (glyoxalase superfamily)
MQKITPHLWFDAQAHEAAELYTNLFPNSRVIGATQIHDTPSGNADIIEAEIAGLHFTLLNAGPYFKFTPAISFSVSCATPEKAKKYWDVLSQGGKVMMEFQEYPFSPMYGWTADKYGLSWQISTVQPGQTITQKIMPSLMFTGAVAGKAEEAMNMYESVFHNADFQVLMRYADGEEPDRAGSVKYAQMTLDGTTFTAMDSSYEHGFTFNEAISFLIHCEDQEEIDYYWKALSADPAAEQCGWLKDAYGVSWQVVPTAMERMMSEGTPEQLARVTQAFLKMKKFDIGQLEAAYQGKV